MALEITFSEARRIVPTFSCIDATVPLCMSPSLNCKNKVVLPEPDGPNSKTEFPLCFGNSTRRIPAARKIGQAVHVTYLLKSVKSTRLSTRLSDAHLESAEARLDRQGSKETGNFAQPLLGPAPPAHQPVKLLDQKCPLCQVFEGTGCVRSIGNVQKPSIGKPPSRMLEPAWSRGSVPLLSTAVAHARSVQCQ